MLRSLKELFGYNIHAVDGEIGKVHDFYFDDDDWITRYLVVDTGPWILGRKVLLSPEALGHPDWAEEIFPVELTREDVKGSPDVKTALPVSRQQQIALHEYYSWPRYWVPYAPSSRTPVPGIPTPISSRTKIEREAVEKMEQTVSHLRSAQELMDYTVTGKDEESLGKVDDIIINDEIWKVHYLVLDTSSWLSTGKKTLIATHWIDWIDFKDNEVHIDLPQRVIESSPSFDPETPINRSYEEVVYDYYGKPYIWVEKETSKQN